MPAGSTFKVRGVKQNSQVIVMSGFNTQAEAEQAGDDLVASGFFVTYTIIEVPANPNDPPTEYDQL